MFKFEGYLFILKIEEAIPGLKLKAENVCSFDIDNLFLPEILVVEILFEISSFRKQKINRAIIFLSTIEISRKSPLKRPRVFRVGKKAEILLGEPR